MWEVFKAGRPRKARLLSVSKEGVIYFGNKSDILKHLNGTKQVVLLYDKQAHKIGIRQATKDDNCKYTISQQGKGRTICCRGLIKVLEYNADKTMRCEWELDITATEETVISIQLPKPRVRL